MFDTGDSLKDHLGHSAKGRSKEINGNTAILKRDGATIWYDSKVFRTFEPRLFDPAWLKENGILRGGSKGRAEAHFLRHSDRDMVLRHFRRGGLIGKINPDLYLYTRAKQCRAMREYDLLVWMQGEGLNVPRPLAARHQPVGLFYRADLITERLPLARPLADILHEHPIDGSVWLGIGAEIKRLHSAGVFHADLNCRNILLDDQNKPWLIDFDKSGARPAGDWTDQNLSRLNRSFEKERALHPNLHWGDQQWAALLDGYEAGQAK
jgi:tRNA A-37 threonylcarbamoyl transferase component Bud32